MAPTTEERLAVLETKQDESDRDRIVLHQDIKDQGQDIKAIKNDVHEIRENIRGHVGFLRGLVFAFTAVGGAIGAASAAVWNKLAGHG